MKYKSSWQRQNNHMVRLHLDETLQTSLMHLLYDSSAVNESLQHRADSALAYFDFNFNEPEKLIFRNMLHLLVFQLWNQCPGSSDPLMVLYEIHMHSQQPTVDELLDVLKKSIGFFSHTFIVIDGVDECIRPERTSVLEFLAEIQSWDLQPLHMLAASRPEQEIKEKIDSFHGARQVNLYDYVLHQTRH